VDDLYEIYGALAAFYGASEPHSIDDRARWRKAVDAYRRLASHLPSLLDSQRTGQVCASHGKAVLVTHVDDGEPCSDYLAERAASPEERR
jgi:hypothetical protein